MSADMYKQAKRIFLEVCDLPAGDQARKLDELCGGDAALRAEVDSLLEHYDVDVPSADLSSGAPTIVRPPSPESPRIANVGPYRIMHELGQGGMGVVYLGQHEEGAFKRRAAIKVLKRGMDTDDILRRFDLERQVLAALNHANIARLYEGGETEDGRPYFAMEYVEGMPIDEYCDTRRLPIDARLELFRTVCSAVQHAHQNLIVHRDLKPSNILVDKDGNPKLLDFGIAKLINPEMSFIEAHDTAPELRVMTPEYASPEQVRGNPITTLSDIYSLGVLLYELVSGHRPYRLRSRIREEIVRVVCEEDPQRPSTAISSIEEVNTRTATGHGTTSITPESVGRTRELRPDRLRRRLTGDVDNIVLMAMRKEPQRRYTSAEQLGDDIRRHLEGDLVMARKDTLAYRSVVFIRRHRVGVATTGVVAASLIVGLSTAVSGWRAADTERANAITARDEARDARDLADKHLLQVIDYATVPVYDVYQDIKHIDGTLPARQTILDGAMELLETISADIEGENHEVTRFRTGLIEQIGVTLVGFEGVTGADADGGLAHVEQALALRRGFLKDSPADETLQLELSRTLLRRATLLRISNRPADALVSSQEALAMLRGIGQPDLRLLGTALYEVGSASHLLDQPSADLYDECLQVRREAAAAEPENSLRQRDLAVILNRVGAARRRANEFDAARDLYAESLAIRTARLEQVTNAQTLNDFASCLILVADLERQMQAYDDAIRHATRGRAILQERVCLNTDSPRYADSLSKILRVLGDAHFAKGEVGMAALNYSEAVDYATTAVERVPSSSIYRRSCAQGHRGLADVATASGDSAGAADALASALEALAPLLEAERPDARAVRDAIGFGLELAARRIDLKQLSRGLTALRDVRDEIDRHVAPDRHRPYVDALVASYRDIARLMVDLGDPAGARTALTTAIGVLGPYEDEGAESLREAVTAEIAALNAS
ncbi:MAG: serine/threonine protein kinase [Planctomycetota bacterium]|jgi:serine/threonine protein kinase/tetratricopeptide (TPR) repeat protein